MRTPTIDQGIEALQQERSGAFGAASSNPFISQPLSMTTESSPFYSDTIQHLDHDAAHYGATTRNHERGVKIWEKYLETLCWEKGSLDATCWSAALRAASLGVEEEFVFERLCDLVEEAGDEPPVEKIQSQIDRARAHVKENGTQTVAPANESKAGKKTGPSPKRPKVKLKDAFCPARLEALAARLTVENIEQFISNRSASRPEWMRSADFLSALYPPGEHVLVFTNCESQGQFLWPDDNHSGNVLPEKSPEGVWFLINPVDSEQHPNPRHGGKMSRRSEESVTSFRFALLESDKADRDQWLKFLAQAPLPISAIYSSGGRSVHALVRVDATSKQDWDSMVNPVKVYLASFGADPGALTAIRLSRLPQAWRGDNQQKLIYIYPAPDGTAICERPIRQMHLNCIQWIDFKLRDPGGITCQQAQVCRNILNASRELPGVEEALSKLSKASTGGQHE